MTPTTFTLPTTVGADDAPCFDVDVNGRCERLRAGLVGTIETGEAVSPNG